MRKTCKTISCGDVEHGGAMLACAMKMVVPTGIKPPHRADAIIEF
jgi:hypothetical protein